MDASTLEVPAVIPSQAAMGASGPKRRWSGVWALAALLGCANPPGEEAPPTVTLQDMRLHSYRGNQLVSTGRADSISYVRSTAEFSAQNMWLKLPQRGEGEEMLRGNMEVRARTLVGNTRERKAEGQGGVTMRSSDGVVANSSSMWFDANEKSASGNERITVTAPRYALEANAFHLSFEDQIFNFKGKVESWLGGAPDGGMP